VQITILTRYVEVPSGRGRPGPLGAALSEAFSGAGWRVTTADPLDMPVDLAPGPKAPGPAAALVALSPLRPDWDLPVLRQMARSGVELRNRLGGLENFTDPVWPLAVLAAAGISVAPARLLRKPLGPEDREVRLPAHLEVLLPDGSGERMIVRDRGSLDGILGLVWRKDGRVLLREGEEEEALRIPAAGGEIFFSGNELPAEAEALVRAAARALRLDFLLVEAVRSGGTFSAARVFPFAAEGPRDLTEGMCAAIVRTCASALRP
jgi:hypothetical protein